KINQIVSEKEPRVTTSMREFNRVLGGGVVPGSLVLIGGDPGIGKSTLLLQISAQIADKDLTVLYISGEESIQQTKLKAERLGVITENLYVLSETNLHKIIKQIDDIKPNDVVVYSNQTMLKAKVMSSTVRVSEINEMGICEMKELGLQEVMNPSEIFLEERSRGASGSTVVASMEGTRPVLVEIQALISPSSFGNPRRMATGVDSNRVPLLMAVLE